MARILPPAPPTTFAGRATELRALATALDDARQVTNAGPGGSGKTRLAIEAARRGEEVCWADLTGTTDPLVVPELVASAAGVLPDRGALPSHVRPLRDRRMLVCLDNCEHVVDAAAEVAAALIRACPGVTVLATGREPLRVPGEVVWRVPPLSAAAAVALYEERSGTGPAPAAVRTACARLAALLVRGPRGVAARHQTLAASMAWSHDLLDEDDRVLFRRLGAFHGGFTLDAARGVCGSGRVAVLTGLRRLVDKSLVIADTRGSVARYRMLETVREYAVARLEASPEAGPIRDRHLDVYLPLPDDARPPLARDMDAWREAGGAERENLLAAAEWGLAQDDPERGRRLAAGLPWLWHLNGRGHEGLTLLRRAVTRGADERTPLQARLLTGLALVADAAHPAGPARA